jgi:hypothetical protein
MTKSSGLSLVLTAWLLVFTTSLTTPAEAPAQSADAPARQVTVFGVLATPDDAHTDPKLAKIEPQLRKLLPKHGFRLLDVQTKRLTSGKSLTCDLEDGYTASTTLVEPLDLNGKVQLRCTLLQKQAVRFETKVTTPANQLFFCDKVLENGSRILIGIGAR